MPRPCPVARVPIPLNKAGETSPDRVRRWDSHVPVENTRHVPRVTAEVKTPRNGDFR